jgi:cysteine-rich repeat protein
MNGTGYGHCTTECTPGPRCGDKILQPDLNAEGLPIEQCDNGVNASGYYMAEGDCAPGCVLPPFCGDANVDSGYSEQCDFGIDNDNAKYGGCTKACQLGPRCGDGIQQTDVDAMGVAYEDCDDGNVKNNDGCSVACKKEPKFQVK